jgi:hypothetical protein
MAIGQNTQWRIRVGGDNLNSGGFDPTISGAGTDYTDQDAPQLSLTDLATGGAGSTTLSSAAGGFTSAMIGNCIRIASGTNFVAGYYFVTAYGSANSVTLDRSPSPSGSGSGGTGRLGGAFSGIENFNTGGGLALPAITSPLAPGHTVYVRGSGSDNPSTVDYVYTTYWQPPIGEVGKRIRWFGYNGRPSISYPGLWMFSPGYTSVTNFKFVTSSDGYVGHGAVSGSGGIVIENCYFDQAGYDAAVGTAQIWSNCYVFNSGSKTAGIFAVVRAIYYASVINNIIVRDCRGPAISVISSTIITNCQIFNNGNHGINVVYEAGRGGAIINNTINGNGGHGIYADNVEFLSGIHINNNIITNHTASGKYGIYVTSPSTDAADRAKLTCDYNTYYNNTAHLHNMSHGENDLINVDPQFIDPTSGDLTPQNELLLGNVMSMTIP